MIEIDLSKCKPIARYEAIECKPAPDCKACKGSGVTHGWLKCVCTVKEFIEVPVN